MIHNSHTHMQMKDLYFLGMSVKYWEELLFYLKKCFGVVDECCFQFLVEQVNLIFM